MSSSAQRSSAAPAGDAPGRTGFLRRITVATAFGEGLDGYDLGVISVVLPLASTALDLTTVEEGLLGASSLAGIFFGGPIFGYLTDRFGRRKIFILDLIAFVILGAGGRRRLTPFSAAGTRRRARTRAAARRSAARTRRCAGR